MPITDTAVIRGSAYATQVPDTMRASNQTPMDHVVHDGIVLPAAATPQQTASISFTSASGNYDWELRDRTSNALLSSGSGTCAPRACVASFQSCTQPAGRRANDSGVRHAAVGPQVEN